ncbi:MAG TPA: hypothetical protein VIL78_11660 [Hanamia sp.]
MEIDSQGYQKQQGLLVAGEVNNCWLMGIILIVWPNGEYELFQYSQD